MYSFLILSLLVTFLISLSTFISAACSFDFVFVVSDQVSDPYDFCKVGSVTYVQQFLNHTFPPRLQQLHRQAILSGGSSVSHPCHSHLHFIHSDEFHLSISPDDMVFGYPLRLPMLVPGGIQRHALNRLPHCRSVYSPHGQSYRHFLSAWFPIGPAETAASSSSPQPAPPPYF
ncbi:hypothetical protein SK128_017383 [Halocaridina rubra]|uniref:Uncharacterized protein n=1 Tax=Halocaridina rubra TaxID=373956 RepID=A0AAN8XJ45_HALRR